VSYLSRFGYSELVQGRFEKMAFFLVDPLAEAMKQYMRHCPMQHVQGYSGSHWTLPLGDYSLRIAPATARATTRKTTMQNVPTLLAILMAIAMRQYNTKLITQWRRYRAFINATTCHHQASTCSDSTNRTCQCRLILAFHHEKGLELICWPLITIGV